MVNKQHLIEIVKKATNILNPSQIEWFCNNVIEPQKKHLITNLDKMSKKQFLQITDCNSNSYYIVYDFLKDEYGICCILSSGEEWYLGGYGSIIDAINNM